MASAGPGPCPDTNLLSGFAEGRLLEEERDALESHLAGCDGCRSAVRLLDHGRPPARRAPARALLAAAAVLLVSAGAFLAWKGGSPPREERFRAAAAEVARLHPGLGEELRLPAREERLRRAEGLRGTGLRAMLPAGRVLDARPGFRWAGGPPGGEVRVALEGPGGVPLWTVAAMGEGAPFPSDRPALEPGRTYTWAVAAATPLGPVEARRAFTVAAVDERREFEEAMLRIDASAPADGADLLKAVLALSRDFRVEAVGFARRAVEALPGEPVAGEILFQALERTGAPEADRWLPADGAEGGR